uniref:Uncharacterized protein n=1 Tax=Micrurus corallinus TaxID=54390 RepID=A0A2D4EW56_MICCO
MIYCSSFQISFSMKMITISTPFFSLSFPVDKPNLLVSPSALKRTSSTKCLPSRESHSKSHDSQPKTIRLLFRQNEIQCRWNLQAEYELPWKINVTVEISSCVLFSVPPKWQHIHDEKQAVEPNPSFQLKSKLAFDQSIYLH